MTRQTRALACAAAVGLLLALFVVRTKGSKGLVPEAAAAHPAHGSTYAVQVMEVTKRRDYAARIATLSPDSWIRKSQLAAYHMEFAQLTGDYEGYAGAERALAEAFVVAGRRVADATDPVTAAIGPFLIRGELGCTLHRFRACLADLDKAEEQAMGDRHLLADITALRGSARFSLGEYSEGKKLLEQAARIDPSASNLQRLAIAHWKTGRFDEASRLFTLADPKVSSARARAWTTLQRALMDVDRGRYAEAQVHFAKAQELFPGWWHVDEHRAELLADEGKTEAATAAYRKILASTGDPEFMDALARLIAKDEPLEAKKLTASAGALYEERLVRFPEASYGHALEHFLRMDPDREKSLSIAAKNRELRPDGEARTRLAQAYLKAGRVADASAEIQLVIASEWINAESFATAALAFEASGDRAAATSAAAKASALRPDAAANLAWLREAMPR